MLFLAVATVGIAGPPSLPMEPRVVLPAMVRGADRAVVSRFEGNRSVAIHVIDPTWMEDVARVLERASFRRTDPCFCVTPGVQFYLGDRSLSLSLHHGGQLRCSSAAISGDFVIGEESGQQFVELLDSAKSIVPGAKVEVPASRITSVVPSRSELRLEMQRPPSRPNQSLQPTATAVTPRADARVAPAAAVAEQ